MRLATTTFLTVSKSHHSLPRDRRTARRGGGRAAHAGSRRGRARAAAAHRGAWRVAARCVGRRSRGSSGKNRKAESADAAREGIVMTNRLGTLLAAVVIVAAALGVHHPRRVEEFRAGRRVCGFESHRLAIDRTSHAGVPRTERSSERRQPRPAAGCWRIGRIRTSLSSPRSDARPAARRVCCCAPSGLPMAA